MAIALTPYALDLLTTLETLKAEKERLAEVEKKFNDTKKALQALLKVSKDNNEPIEHNGYVFKYVFQTRTALDSDALKSPGNEADLARYEEIKSKYSTTSEVVRLDIKAPVSEATGG